MRATTISISRALLPILLHITALAFIYFVPTLSHLLSLPLYFIEPMRLMVVLAMVHSHRVNAYLLALTLPVFSFIVSGHPVAIKMIIISAELLLNVWLFYFLYSRIKSSSIALLSSIILSKVAYYGAKFILITLGVFKGSNLAGIPLWVQAITIAVFTLYSVIIHSRRKN